MYKIFKLKINVFIWTALALWSSDSHAQRLAPFESATLNTAVTGGEKIPFEKTVSYFGYISDSSHADTIYEEKPVYHHYFFLPGDVSELGIRLISPVPELFFADKGDIETEEFSTKNPAEKATWFDAAIMLDKIDIKPTILHETVNIAEVNYKSKEVPTLPNGKIGNPLIRIINGNVSGGFYRLSVINEITEQTKTGSYIIQIGTVPRMRGIRISRVLGDILH